MTAKLATEMSKLDAATRTGIFILSRNGAMMGSGTRTSSTTMKRMVKMTATAIDAMTKVSSHWSTKSAMIVEERAA